MKVSFFKSLRRSLRQHFGIFSNSFAVYFGVSVRWRLETLFHFIIRCTVGCDTPYFRDKRLCETPTLSFALDSNFFVVALVNLIGRLFFSISGFYAISTTRENTIYSTA